MLAVVCLNFTLDMKLREATSIEMVNINTVDTMYM